MQHAFNENILSDTLKEKVPYCREFMTGERARKRECAHQRETERVRAQTEKDTDSNSVRKKDRQKLVNVMMPRP